MKLLRQTLLSLIIPWKIYGALGWIPPTSTRCLAPSSSRISSVPFRDTVSRRQASSTSATPNDFTSSAARKNVPSTKTTSSTTTTTATSTNWIVYVDHSKQSLEKGAAATLDAFTSLAPPSSVQVKAAALPRPSKKAGSSSQPWVRCVNLSQSQALEVYGVDSVDKVYRVLTKHMALGVSQNKSSFMGGVTRSLGCGITLTT